MAGKVKLKVVPSMFSDFIEKLNTVASIDDTVKLKIDNENILMYAMLGGGNVILAFKNFLLPTKEYFDNDMEDFSLDIIIPSAKKFVKNLAFIKDMDKESVRKEKIDRDREIILHQQNLELQNKLQEKNIEENFLNFENFENDEDEINNIEIESFIDPIKNKKSSNNGNGEVDQNQILSDIIL